LIVVSIKNKVILSLKKNVNQIASFASFKLSESRFSRF